MATRRRPWKVTPGFPTGRGDINFDATGTGIRTTSYATESAARRAALAMTAGTECFAAVRLYSLDWQPGVVDEYHAGPDPMPRRVDTLHPTTGATP